MLHRVQILGGWQMPDATWSGSLTVSPLSVCLSAPLRSIFIIRHFEFTIFIPQMAFTWFKSIISSPLSVFLPHGGWQSCVGKVVTSLNFTLEIRTNVWRHLISVWRHLIKLSDEIEWLDQRERIDEAVWLKLWETMMRESVRDKGFFWRCKCN